MQIFIIQISLFIHLSQMGQTINHDEIRKKKNLERDLTIKNDLVMLEKIIQEEKITPEFIENITRMTIENVVDQLNAGRVTSRQLTAIYSHRAATIGLRLSLITEVNFKNAITLAEKCDQVRKSTKKRNWTFQDSDDKIQQFLHPLFGLPISIKDTFDMEGLSSTIGITHRAFQLQKEDGILVSAMKEGGLIPFTKSNVPQLAMIFQSNNYLWGRGKNPWNIERCIGGSSGGQGGLIAARCSLLGIGSDIGGSIRIPAEFNGVYGLKSSDSRLSNNFQTDYSVSFSGMDTLKVVIGPLSNSVEGLALWMKTATNEQLYKGKTDPYIKNIAFDSKIYKQYQNKKKLKIGYLKSFQLIESTKASQRAVDQTVIVIQSLGHTAVPVQIPNDKLVIRAFFSELAAEGDSLTFTKMLKGQKFTPEYNQVNTISTMNSILFSIVNAVYRRTAPRIGFLLDGSGKKTVHEYLIHAGTVLQYRQQFGRFWRENQLDFIVMPGFGCQASLHGYADKISLAACYTFIWNVLGVTVGSMPVTLSKNDEQVYESAHRDQITDKLRETAKQSSGLPVGIQVVGLPFQDEKVLGFMKVLEKQLQFYKKHPLPKIQ